MVGSPRAARAIGNVMHINQILLIIPCHRVLAKNGLGGYRCGGVAKLTILQIENPHFTQGRKL